jgi:hypothetical protein
VVCSKGILRELIKDKLPPAILNREKIGFDIRAPEWLRGPLRVLLETLYNLDYRNMDNSSVVMASNTLKRVTSKKKSTSDITSGDCLSCFCG